MLIRMSFQVNENYWDLTFQAILGKLYVISLFVTLQVPHPPFSTPVHIFMLVSLRIPSENSNGRAELQDGPAPGFSTNRISNLAWNVSHPIRVDVRVRFLFQVAPRSHESLTVACHPGRRGCLDQHGRREPRRDIADHWRRRHERDGHALGAESHGGHWHAVVGEAQVRQRQLKALSSLSMPSSPVHIPYPLRLASLRLVTAHIRYTLHILCYPSSHLKLAVRRSFNVQRLLARSPCKLA